MSDQPNKELILQGYHLFRIGDLDGLLRMFADDAEWAAPTVEFVPFSGNYHGKEEIAQFFTDMLHAQEAQRFEPEELIAESDRVVVCGEAIWSVRATSQTYGGPWVHIFTVRDGKIARFEQYFDTAAARAAFMPTDASRQQAGTGPTASLLH